MESPSPAKQIGRPRAFQKVEALDSAMKVFWRKGYQGTSLSDLTRAMGINRPSLYATFGSKESLFKQSLDRYVEGPAGYVQNALEKPTARAAVEALMLGAVNVTTDRKNPRGCLMLQGAMTCGGETEAVRRDINARLSAGEKAIRRRLRRAQKEGDLVSDVDAGALARYVVTVVRGIGVQAASGASREELRKVVLIALQAWPK